MAEQWHVFITVLTSRCPAQGCQGVCVCADLTHVQRPLTPLFASEQVQLSTQHPVLVPARAVQLAQHQLAWGAWRGTAGTRASVNSIQWSPSSLASQSLLVHIPATHLLPGWFGLLKWCWEYPRWRCHSPTVCGSPMGLPCTRCHLQKSGIL